MNFFYDIVKEFVCIWAIRANNTSEHRTMSSFLDTTVFMPPTSKKLMGHIGFGLSVRSS